MSWALSHCCQQLLQWALSHCCQHWLLILSNEGSWDLSSPVSESSWCWVVWYSNDEIRSITPMMKFTGEFTTIYNTNSRLSTIQTLLCQRAHGVELCDTPMMKFVSANSQFSSSESHNISVNSFVSRHHWVRASAAILYAMGTLDFETLSSWCWVRGMLTQWCVHQQQYCMQWTNRTCRTMSAPGESVPPVLTSAATLYEMERHELVTLSLWYSWHWVRDTVWNGQTCHKFLACVTLNSWYWVRDMLTVWWVISRSCVCIWYWVCDAEFVTCWGWSQWHLNHVRVSVIEFAILSSWDWVRDMLTMEWVISRSCAHNAVWSGQTGIRGLRGLTNSMSHFHII